MKEFAMNGTPVKMWAKMCDATAWQQISNLCSLPFVFHHLALMIISLKTRPGLRQYKKSLTNWALQKRVTKEK